MLQKQLVWLDDIDVNDKSLVGEKFAKIATLAKFGALLSNGFLITHEAYLDFIKQNNLETKINHLSGSITDKKKLGDAIQKELTKSVLPERFVNELLKAYTKISGKLSHPILAISTSQPTYKSTIKGEANLILAIKHLWTEFLFTNSNKPFAIFVQLFLEPEKEGVFPLQANASTLASKDEIYLSDLAEKVRQEFYFPHEIHWMMHKNQLYITNIKESIQKNNPTFTATKLYITAKDSQDASSLALQQVDGIGFLDTKEKIVSFAKVFSPRPVVYALSSVTNSEELEEVKLARNKHGLKNIWLLLPVVRTVKELQEIKQLIASIGLYRSPSFKLWMMITTPSNVILLDEFIKQGVDGVSINSKDLTRLMLGTDKDNSEVNEDESLLWAYQHVIKTANKHGVSSSLYGPATNYSSLLKKCVDWGITSITVHPDTTELTKEYIARFEKELVV